MSNDQKITRKLKAILSADVKGYSLLMADDEVLTLRTLNEYRDIMSELIQSHSGRVVDSVGDNMLSEFSSAVDAVECAIKIQESLKKENAKFVDERKLQFRIGINIGDVIHQDGRIIGEGVNLASRIEGLADAGSVCISKNTFDQIEGKLDIQTKYLGEHQVKNINKPVRVYKVLLDSDEYKPLIKEKLDLPDKPSIAVLPFTNMSGDPSQEYFSDGLTEQIINGLCKVPDLFVIARNSSFAYKGKAVSVKQIAQELGVKYILEGSVQRAGERVRITAQLIDAETDFHMFSENYDRDLSDIFALQDEITLKLIEEMHIELTYGEQARLWEGFAPNIQAYDKLMKGLEHLTGGAEKNNSQAIHFFNEAIRDDQNYSYAYTLLGYTHLMNFMWGGSDNPLRSFEEAEKNATKALEINDSLDLAHSLLGWIYLFKRQYEEAIKEGKRAIELNPNGADAHASMGNLLAYADNADKAINFLQKAIRMNPIPQNHYYQWIAMAYRLDEQYEKAIESGKKSIRINPDHSSVYITMAACYSLLGRNEDAIKAVKEIKRIDPNFSLEYLSMILPYKNQDILDKFINALRKAGLPD